MSFYSGQKITLRRPSIWEPRAGQPMPQKMPIYGEVYTVLRSFLLDDTASVWLYEFPEILPGYRYPQPYEACAFRPVLEREIDVSIFTKQPMAPAKRAEEVSLALRG